MNNNISSGIHQAQNVAGMPPSYGPSPVTVTCPSCQTKIKTKIDTQPGVVAWVMGTVLCIVGNYNVSIIVSKMHFTMNPLFYNTFYSIYLGCICCFWIPCIVDSLKVVKHSCPNCNQFLGTYRS